MKLSTFFLALSILTVSGNSYAQKTRLSVNLKNASIKEIFMAIEQQSEFRFLYRDELINAEKRMNINMQNSQIFEILDKMVLNANVNYKVLEDHLIVITPKEKENENHQVSGIIKTIAGEPLPGVNILEKGTMNGTVTNLDGEFSILVSTPQSVLSVSYIGYNAKEISVNNQSRLNIILEESIESLDEVIVVGYGTQKKSDITGAIASVESAEINQLPVIGIDQALQGKASGVQITQNTGSPGAGVSVRIRGTGTVGNSDPLYVVDGLPIDAENVTYLNPGDIESVQVLKDASSSAIYGSRGANGVILITTKKGTPGEKGTIEFNAYRGIQSVWKYMDMMTAEEFIDTRNRTGGYPEEEIPIDSLTTDWQKEVFRDAPVKNYQLSFLGGGDKTAYAISGNYFNQQGIVRGSAYDRLSFRINTSTEVFRGLTVGENLAFVNSNRDIILEADEWNSVIITTLTIDPAIPVYNEETTWQASQRNNITNPVGRIERNNNTYKTNNLVGNFYANLEPLKGLVLRSNIGINYRYGNSYIYRPTFNISPTEQLSVSELERTIEKWQSWIWENTATYNTTLGKHNINLLAGVTSESNDYENIVAFGYDAPNQENLRYFDNTDPAHESRLINGGSWEHRLYSLIGRIEYGYDNRYLINASFRRDGSSIFGEDKRFGNFPAFGLAWRISEEPFMDGIPIIYFLKLRAGWGQIGNQNLGDSKYPSAALITPGYNYVLGQDQVLVSGGAPATAANTKLQWESTSQTNIGADIGLWNNSVSFTADYFIRTTSDMLVEVPIPGHAGLEDAPFANAGEVENRGFETSLSIRQKLGDFNFELNGNISFIKNKLISLGKGGQDIYSASFRAVNLVSITRVGDPIASFYGHVTDGLFQTQEEIDALNAIAQENGYRAYQTVRTGPGDIKFKDLDGNGVINQDDRDIIGNPHPDFFYGISFFASYKGIDLSVTGQGTYGNDLFNATIWYTESSGYWNLTKRMTNFWTPENPDTDIPRVDPNNYNQNNRMSDRYVEDGSYFRIKNVQLGYTIPLKYTQRIKVERLRLYVAAHNIITLTEYNGFDPEIGLGVDNTGAKKQSSALDIGVDRGTYPQAKTIMAGINFSF